MADNVTLPPTGTGTADVIVASDKIGGVDYQRIKLSLGADGVVTDQIGIVAGLDAAGTGVAAAGLVGQLDDTATTVVTEDQFAPLRISSRRALLVEGVTSGTPQPVSVTVSGDPFWEARSEETDQLQMMLMAQQQMIQSDSLRLMMLDGQPDNYAPGRSGRQDLFTEIR